MKEELRIDLDKTRLKHKKTLENFFDDEGLKFHEIYFIYEYDLNDSELAELQNVRDNFDNKDSYFKFIDFKDLDKVNILPIDLIDIIEE